MRSQTGEERRFFDKHSMKLDFVVWMILYPLAEGVVSFLAAKNRRDNGKKPYDDDVVAVSSGVHLLLWVVIGFLLW
jgi:hypothetical protein